MGGALGKLAGKLEQPLWGAVLDSAIADAITLKPDNKADKLGRSALAAVLAAGPKRALNRAAPAASAQARDPGEDQPG